ncbi:MULTISPECIES: hypothetical protein [unclassified Rathayibacter]|uniref:hypothetical protein n=1 Tax=unclassified Rathayibacter TaxID=2609250 RepID=UPI0007008F31|nr:MULTISPECIES: hypothetical protein [unclassified Rathayibacter]KQQ06014.1 hypothetical protein ASF42_05625 [Rathayibacter sp. Leaf294]KQS13871.1 hypothetical protein ASG06_05635 [Rathayibacter sp. Leaf185]
MKRLRYAGGSLLVGDSVAHALLAYARDLALASASDTVMLIGLTEDGARDEAEMLIGPSSQLFADTAEGPESLPDDEATIAEMESRRSRLLSHPVRLEDQQIAEDSEWYAEWPTDSSSRPD